MKKTNFKFLRIILIVVLLFSVAVAYATLNVYTWTDQTNSGTKMWKGIAGSSDLSKIYAVELSTGRIFRSTDSGVNWSQSNASAQSWLDITSSSDGVKTAAISNVSGNVYTSTNSGVDWSLSAGAGTRNWTAITSSADGSVIVASAYSEGIYMTTNSGSSWGVLINAGNRSWQDVAMSSDGTKMVAVVNPGAIYLSSDSGANWSTASASTTAAWQSVTSSADGTKLVAVVKGGFIYTSSNGGATWATSTAPSANWQSITSSSDGTRLLAVIDNGHIYASGDSGATWVDQTVPGTRIWFSTALSSDGSRAVATAYNGDIWTGVLDVVAPTVSLDPHLDNRHFGPGNTFFSAQATDNQSVASVQFYINDVAYGSAMTTPTLDNLYNPSFNPTLLGEGTYTLKAVATDTTGNISTTSPITFYVNLTPAVLTEVTPVPSTVTDASVIYRYSASFSTTNANTQELFVDSCDGVDILADALSTTTVMGIQLSGLSAGSTYTCTVRLRDLAFNYSNTLTIGPFTRIVPNTNMSGVNVSSMTGVGPVYGCKDPNAINYNYFSAHDSFLCKYADIASSTVQEGVSKKINIVNDLDVGMSGPDVVFLQNFLIDLNIGNAAQALAKKTATGYYGVITRAAVREFQTKSGINPVNGRVGPKTKAAINSFTF